MGGKNRGRLLLASVIPAISVGPTVLLCLAGTPCTTVTWVFLMLPVIWGCVTAYRLLTAERFPKWTILTVLLLAICPLYCVDEANRTVWLDMHSGDIAYGYTKWILVRRTVSDSVQSAMVRHYCGERAPCWVVVSASMVRSIRVDCCQCELLRADWLPRLYVLLPHEEARRQVFECLFDTKNCSAADQALLIACLVQWELPPGETAETWWEKHSRFFQPEHDAKKAAEFWFGWTRRVREMPRGELSKDGGVAGAIRPFFGADPSPDWHVAGSYHREMFEMERRLSELTRNQRKEWMDNSPTSAIEW